jgi:hypothetical protein
MSHRLPTPLPRFDRGLLSAAARIAPSAERQDWRDSWQAELWHMHSRPRSWIASLRLTADVSFGIVLDALWLRTESWRRSFGGTPSLCLASLFSLCSTTLLLAVMLNDGSHQLLHRLHAPFQCSLTAAPLIIFVAFATASHSHIEQGSRSRPLASLNRKLFHLLKILLILVFTCLLSTDITRPLHNIFPLTADLIQVLAFVVFSLLGLRWSLHDQEQRCKQCLRLLTTPARVGRPSRNLLEWNGTEQVCKQGHGTLSVPEIETSWHQYSQWIDQVSESA